MELKEAELKEAVAVAVAAAKVAAVAEEGEMVAEWVMGETAARRPAEEVATPTAGAATASALEELVVARMAVVAVEA